MIGSRGRNVYNTNIDIYYPKPPVDLHVSRVFICNTDDGKIVENLNKNKFFGNYTEHRSHRTPYKCLSIMNGFKTYVLGKTLIIKQCFRWQGNF